MSIVVLNLIPFALALLLAFSAVRQTLRNKGMAFLTAGAMLGLFIAFASYLPQVTTGEPVTYAVEWVPSLGLTLSWYLDSLALLFALVVTGIGIAVFFYAGFYLERTDELGRFYSYLLAFSGSMLALVLSGNVFMLFIAWEGTSVMSFMLIGFKGNKSQEARTAASRALIVTGGGGLALFVGLMLLGVATNSLNGLAPFAEAGFQLSLILNTPIVEHGWYLPIVILVLAGAFTKSAQFPFHFWLPGAMTAPSPASAYLHSATMVKAGIYLLFRLYPTLGESWLWVNSLLIIGLITMFIGAFFALRQRDLKGLLAYSTVSTLGAIVALIGLPEAHGLKAAAITIVAHALYKATFFLMAGTIEHSTGTRNLDELGGLARKMPLALSIAVLVGLSMAGLPPFIGFAAKEFLLDEILPANGVGVLPVIVAFASSLFMVTIAFLYVWDGFITPRKSGEDYAHFHAPPLLMHVGPGLLALASLFGGIFITPLLTDLTSGILGKPTSVYILPTNLNPLENTALALSLLVLIGGPLLFVFRARWMALPQMTLPTGQFYYARFIRFWEAFGDLLLKTQNGNIRHYLTVILGVVAVLMLAGGYANLRPLHIDIRSSVDVLRVLLLVMTIGATLASVILKQHILAALALGVSGYTIGGLFLLEPAPDVALVQILVETLATVLIILMIARISLRQRQEAIHLLWRKNGDDSGYGVWRDATIATVIGVSVGLFALAAVDDRSARLDNMLAIQDSDIQPVMEGPLFDITRPIALWHLENAYPRAGVEDVVSAILADFRGMDTLLEIAVFSTAALGVLTLLVQPKGREILIGKSIREEFKAMIQLNPGRQPDTPLVDVKTLEVSENLRRLKAREYAQWSERYGVSRFSTPLTRLSAHLVLPFAILVSLSHVLYGGSGPGDGFTAGVISGLGVALWFVVFGYIETLARLWWLRPGRMVAGGLTIAVLNAALGFVYGGAFFAPGSLDGSPAGLHLTSAVIFEFAIFLTVFGGVTMIISAIAHPEAAHHD
jgi:NADH:ubiquinone oxidoreductase subunit 5 (subunit L)/multisubunit Na+/H+ antiporter MnhA subunit